MTASCCLSHRRRQRIIATRSRLLSLFLCLSLVFLVQGSTGSSPGPRSPPPPPPPLSFNNSNTADSITSTQQQQPPQQQQPQQSIQIQIVETEYWNGERWMGAPHRWTNPEGQASMSPVDLPPPPNGQFEGDWKIVLGDERDDYGWDYHHHYGTSGLFQFPRRQRIWLRTAIVTLPTQPPAQQVQQQQPRRTSPRSSAASWNQQQPNYNNNRGAWRSRFNLQPKTQQSQKQQLPQSPFQLMMLLQAQKAIRQIPTTALYLQSMLETAMQNVYDDWNFKGFGFSFYKSFIFRNSIGFSFRIPLTGNWEVFERHPEWPRLSLSVGFYYPFTCSVTVGGSVNVEYLRWVSLQFLIILRHAIALTLLFLARGFVLAGSALAFPVTGQWYEMPQPHVWLPQLGDTLSLKTKPSFSKTLQERVGMSYSWRLSAKRGYETRRTVWHLYLPTVLSLLQHLDRVQQAGQKLWHLHKHQLPTTLAPKYQQSGTGMMSRYLAGFVPSAVRTGKRKTSSSSIPTKKTARNSYAAAAASKPPNRDTTTTSTIVNDDDSEEEDVTANTFQPVSLLEHKFRDSGWAEFFNRRTASLGVSTSGPTPDPPHFSCSALLSLSGFYFRKDTIRTKKDSSSSTTTVIEDDGQEQDDHKATPGIVPETASSSSSDDMESTDDEEELSSLQLTDTRSSNAIKETTTVRL